MSSSYNSLKQALLCLVLIALAVTVLPSAARKGFSYKSLMKKADRLVRKHKFKEAYPLYKQAVKMRPKDSQAHAGRAWTIYATRAEPIEKAMQEAQLAIKLDPKNATAHNILGAVYFAMGRFPQARQEFITVLRLDPDRRCGGCGTYTKLLGIDPKNLPKPKPGTRKGKRKRGMSG